VVAGDRREEEINKKRANAKLEAYKTDTNEVSSQSKAGGVAGRPFMFYTLVDG
jgi:hypothetical protein